MADATIKVMDKGPLVVSGTVELLDGEGNPYETEQRFALCRCGRSDDKPFCDGSHRGEFTHCARAEEVLARN